MKQRESKRNKRRALAFCLAALLWTEGTLGSVWAAPEAAAGNTGISVSAEGGITVSDGTKAPAESENPAAGGEETPIEGEKPAPGGEETPTEGEKPAAGEEEKPTEGETPAAGEEEKPTEGETPAAGEEETPAEGEEEKPAEGETPVPGEEDSAADEAEEPVKESISENTADTEEELLPEQIPGEAESLGEPPLMTGSGASMGIMSYGNRVMSTEGQSTSRQTPSTADIIARYNAYPWKLDVKNSYSENPSAKKPYKAGHLSDESLNNALNLLNFIRYVAGIPADVALSKEEGGYIELAQAGALVNCVNNKLSHEPVKPQGFPDDLYEKGKSGCESSNIAYNYGNIAKSLRNGWMYDGDSANIKTMGHRRWVLNPSMSQTGFGAVGAYSAMYAQDTGGSKITDYVAWPARNMPIELMNGTGTPWTLSLGSDYQRADQSQVTVTLKNASGKTWTFSEKKKDGYFAVNTGGYGMPNCIIFRPNSVSYNKTSQFQVTVTGLKDKGGNAATVSYNVDFFSLSDTPKEVESVTLNAENRHLLLSDADEKGQVSLYAVLKPSNAADKTLTWASLDAGVAEVDENGLVTAKGVGETTITATAANGMQAACTVKVSQYALSAEGMTSAPDPFDDSEVIYHLNCELQGSGSQGNAMKISVLDGDKFATDEVIWSSENQNVVKVDADGFITPVGVGEARIWADVENGLKILSCEVAVTNAELPTMQMRESSVTMNWQEEKQLRVYLSPAGTKWENGKEKYIKWTTKNPGKAVFWDEEEKRSKEEIIGGNTATVLPLAAGTTTITAEIVDEAGNPAAGIDAAQGRGTASCEVTVQKRVELPAEADRPCLIALTNTQKRLQDIELPSGWSWKDPDMSLAQFSGQRSKLFPAEYLPAQEGNQSPSEAIQPAETLLPVYFLTLEKISMCVKHSDHDDVLQEVSVLESGWVVHCYVNYSFEDTLEQFEEKNAELKNNTWYQDQKTKLLEQLDKSIKLTSSKPAVLTVESVKNAAGATAVSAKTCGSAELKAELKLENKTFRASQKLTVAERVGAALQVKHLDHFGKISGEDPYRYAANLSDFPMSAKNGINSRICLEMTGVTKLTVKSSNSKVAALKSATVKPTKIPQFEFPLMVKAAGTAQITVTGNDPAKTSRTLTLVVTDACPGLSQETVTVNTWQTVGTDFSLYAAKDETGAFYEITDVSLEDAKTGGKHSGKFTLDAGMNTQDGSRRDCSIRAKADTRNGTYKVMLHVVAGGKAYDLPLTVKVVSNKPKCTVKQKNKLNLFYEDTRSLLSIQTEEKIKRVSLTGCNYLVELSNSQDGYYVKPALGATVNSVKKGKLTIELEGFKPLEMDFTVGVEKKALKISPVTGTVTLYPKRGLTSAKISVKNAGTLPWDQLSIKEVVAAKAKGNYEATLLKEEQAVLLTGRNLNQADSFKITIKLQSAEWRETADLVCTVKVDQKEPGIALEKKTLQLNANEAYWGYDAAAAAVRWKNGGDILTTQNVRVSVYCDPKDSKAKALVADSGVIFSVEKENGCYQVRARLNNKAVQKGSYKYIVQAAKDGKVWKTPLTLKIVNIAPNKAVGIAAKGNIDVLNREGSFRTLTPSLKAVNGTFGIPEDRAVKLTGRDAHLFEARWSDNGKTVELRAKDNVTLVTNFQYTVTPLLTLRNINGQTEEIAAAPVKFKIKQGSVKMSVSPKSALLYSGAYNAVDLDMKAVLQGAETPEIEKVTLVGNTDAFAYVYNKDGKGTLTMKDTGRAVKGKSYSLQFQVFFAQRADNVKPVNVKYTVKVK